MSHKEWKIPNAAIKSMTLENAGYSPLLSRILSARGIKTPGEAEIYLARDKALLNDPMLLEDMHKAVSRITEAEKNHEKIVIYGDYDVDGITASCMLCDFFLRRGADCHIYIPDRLDEGYGLNCEAVRALHAEGVGLIITVDCGITACREAGLASSLGMDIIITDHHECPGELPKATAVIDPKHQNSKYPFDALAGVGVAFKLICAVEGESGALLSRYSDLVAVGTVADVMSLTGENRALVYAGLEKLRTDPHPGFAALLKEARAANKPINASIISFVLAPRINAAGRLCQTETSIRLFMAKDAREAAACAKELCELNCRRQELETKVWDDAMEELGGKSPQSPIVLKSPDWHPGVAGIAASRLAETFAVPTVVICLDEGMGKGSCRSFGDFNLFDALSACADLLEGFGGHAFAAGLNIKEEKIDDFCHALGGYYGANPPKTRPALEPELEIEDFSTLTLAGVQALDCLEPCGSGNPRPLICLLNARLEAINPIGGGKHLRLRVGKSGDSMDCLLFAHSLSDMKVSKGETVDICFTPQINEFNSSKSVQLLLADIRPAESREHCQAILNGEAALEKLVAHRPCREELGCAWRSLTDMGGSFSGNVEDLKDRCGELSRETLCMCLKIFDELGLLSLSAAGGRISAEINYRVEKTELDKSPLFRSLWNKV